MTSASPFGSRSGKSPAGFKRRSPFDQPVTGKRERRGFDVGEKRQYLEPNELRDFFRALPPTSFWYPYFYLQYFYGCGLSEPALIKDEDINTRRKTILIRRLKKSHEDDGFREHICAANPKVFECIRTAQSWKERRRVVDNPFLFASNRRTRVVGAERLSRLRNQDGWQAVSRFTAHRMFQRIAEQLKLPKHLRHSHVLRHTRAVMLLAEGETPEKVQSFLGHSSLKMTMRYMDVAARLIGRGDIEL